MADWRDSKRTSTAKRALRQSGSSMVGKAGDYIHQNLGAADLLLEGYRFGIGDDR